MTATRGAYVTNDPLGFVLEAAWGDIVLRQNQTPEVLVQSLCASGFYGDALVMALVQMAVKERARMNEQALFHKKEPAGLLGDVWAGRLMEQLLSLSVGDGAPRERKEVDEMGMNQVTVSGRLTADPVLRDVSGHALCKMRLAFTRPIKRQGQWDKETGFINVEMWHAPAEAAARALRKGDLCVVTGVLKYEEWGNEGQRQSAHSIIANEWELVQQTQAGSQETSNDRGTQRAPSGRGSQSRGRGTRGGGSDVPF